MNNSKARATMEAIFNKNPEAYNIMWVRSIQELDFDHSLVDEHVRFKEERAQQEVILTFRDELMELSGMIVDIHRGTTDLDIFQKQSYADAIEKIVNGTYHKIMSKLIGDKVLKMMSNIAYRSELLNGAFKLSYLN